MRKSLVPVAIILTVLFAVVAVAQTDKKDAPETLIKASKFLEERPLDKSAKDVRGWAIKWIIATDKVSVTVCSLITSGLDKKYKYESELFGQYTIGMAAF